LGTGYIRSGTQLLRNWVRSNMSRVGAKHVQEMSLKSGLGAEYVWLTREKG
jgi:hypothetical protein